MARKGEVIVTEKLGEILKSARTEHGYTREQIAERAGIGVRHLAAIENEKKNPSAEVLCRIVRAIGISADCVAYPETYEEKEEIAQLIRLIRCCDVRDRRAVKAVVNSLLDEAEIKV